MFRPARKRSENRRLTGCPQFLDSENCGSFQFNSLSGRINSFGQRPFA